MILYRDSIAQIMWAYVLMSCICILDPLMQRHSPQKEERLGQVPMRRSVRWDAWLRSYGQRQGNPGSVLSAIPCFPTLSLVSLYRLRPLFIVVMYLNMTPR